jgi:DNA-binding GntR family transcriptional regulator
LDKEFENGLTFNRQQGLDRRVLRDQVREYLVEAILHGAFKAGERIVETRIAQELDVSQGVVREALRELEWMGFIETKPYSGSSVRAISASDLQEIYPVRAALEKLAIRLAIPNLSDQDLRDLRALVDEMVVVSKDGDVSGMVERNYNFHRSIVLKSKNSMLIRAWSIFQFSYWTTIATTELRDELVHLAERHYDLVEALCTHDPEIAAQSMEHHILELMDELAHRKPYAVNASKG